MHFSFSAVALLATATASPFQKRDIEWSFDLFPTTACNGTGDPYSGVGSTGCRADLSTVASAYRLNYIAGGCHIDFYDNTMCDATEPENDAASSLSHTGTCRMPTLSRRYGSYRVTCGDVGELK